MAGMRDIKRRIRSVKNTQQITKAMKMVAAAKLRKAQERVIAARPYKGKLKEVLGRLAQASGHVNHPLLHVRQAKKVAYVLVTADRGLCGGYNANVIRKAMVQLTDSPVEADLIAVGKKGRDFFRRKKQNISKEFIGLGEEISMAEGRQLARFLMDAYEKGEYDEVYLVYTEFITAMRQKPEVVKLLPIDPPEETKVDETEYIFEPHAEDVLATLLPRYVENQVYQVLLEAKASEHGARMTAMGSATDNAAEMISKLTLSYNRARQAAITREISEIVGGANALE
ncbi:MAG: ATP synthase F1 subunit gamma [Bacillota bacterium]|nr:ATP synthase F1 subunit gamma [Bacillota bacterium]